MDANADRDTTEIGVPGIVVRLTGMDVTGATIERSMLTDDEGIYSFDELEQGSYTVAKQQSVALQGPLGLEGTSDTGTAITDIALADDDVLENTDFAELGLDADFISVRWFFASAPTATTALRETVALAAETEGDMELAASIRTGGSEVPDAPSDEDPTEPPDPVDPVVNEPFGEVTVGDFDDPSLLGIRTDLVAGAPPIDTGIHVETSVDYSAYSNPPTYGPHHPFTATNRVLTPRQAGIYETEQAEEDLIHNLEHGHVWISYNPSLIASTDLDALRQLVVDGGENTGVVMTPRAANTEAIALASWGRLLTLDEFDAATIRSFVETNRGKAPEGYIPSGQRPSTSTGEVSDDGFEH